MYKSTTAYADTPLSEYFLDTMQNRPVPKEADDVVYTINSTYNMRPDMLAFDLYGHSDLWWVFAQRNPNILVNPLLDFSTGTTIYLPKLSNLQNALGF